MEDSKNPDFMDQFYLNCGLTTRTLHAGEHIGQPNSASHANALYQTSTFVFKNTEEGAEIFAGKRPGYTYTRIGNPTIKLLEAKINALEGGELKKHNPDLRLSTVAFASGMSAIASTLLAIVKTGDTILMGDVVYGATEHLSSHVLQKFQIKTEMVDTTNLNKVAQALEQYPHARVMYLETPANPLLSVCDIKAISAMCKKVNPEMVIVVDNTFATPYLQRPLELGADVVVHSTTKYICGHGTVIGGLMTTARDDIKDAVYVVLKDVGGVPSPFDCWLVNMGLKTLTLRMDRHCSNAKAVANFLNDHSKVAKVHFPGLPSNEHHQVAKTQMKDFGGMVSIELKGGLTAGKKMMDNIKIFTLAVSLGSVDSLIQHPASMTHACMDQEKRLKAGITDGLVRISVGIEDIDDLLGALDDVLKLV